MPGRAARTITICESHARAWAAALNCWRVRRRRVQTAGCDKGASGCEETAAGFRRGRRARSSAVAATVWLRSSPRLYM